MSREIVSQDLVGRYLSEIRRYPILSREEEYSLARSFRDTGDVNAARALVVSNLRFVVSIAKHYRRSGIGAMELIQEGNIGLMQAVKRFDPERGYRLISYAVWWIRAHIRDFILRMRSVVRSGAIGARRLLSKLRRDDPRSGHNDASTEELALSAQSDATAGSLDAGDFSLDAPSRHGAALRDFLADMATPSPDESVSQRERLDALRGALSQLEATLDARDKLLLEHRLLSDDPRSFAEIGEMLGVSRQRAKQLEARLVARIAEALGVSAQPAATAA